MIWNRGQHINRNYILNNYIEFNNKELFSIISNKQNIFPLICSIENNKKSNIITILIILGATVLSIILLSFILYIKCIKNIKNKKNKENKKRIPNIYKEGLSKSKTEILN